MDRFITPLWPAAASMAVRAFMRILRHQGIRCGRKRVIAAHARPRPVCPPRRRRRKPRTTDSQHTLPVAPNLLSRDFTATAPNRKWVADITAIGTQQGWL